MKFFQIATIALVCVTEAEAHTTLKDAGKSAKKSLHKATKAAGKALKSFGKYLQVGVKSGYDVHPGSQPQKTAADFANLKDCHSCVANLGTWTSNACTQNTAHKDGDMDIEEWFAAANTCTDTLGLCEIGTASKPTSKAFYETMVGVGTSATWANHNAYTIADKGDFTLGWNSTKSASTKVPQDYFCTYELTLKNGGNDFTMTQNATQANVQTYAVINHRSSGKNAPTYWTEAKINESAKPTHGKFLIGPKNSDFQLVFINNNKASTLGSLHNNHAQYTFNYVPGLEFTKLLAMGKGGALAGVFIVLCIVFCLIAALVYKFLAAIKRCICGGDEDKEDGYQRHQE